MGPGGLTLSLSTVHKLVGEAYITARADPNNPTLTTLGLAASAPLPLHTPNPDPSSNPGLNPTPNTYLQFNCQPVHFLYVKQISCALPLTLTLNRSEARLADKQLRQDVGHLVSDMNTCAAHMVDFLRARWHASMTRQGKDVALLSADLAEVMYMLLGDDISGQTGDGQGQHADHAVLSQFFHADGIHCVEVAMNYSMHHNETS